MSNKRRKKEDEIRTFIAIDLLDLSDIISSLQESLSKYSNSIRWVKPNGFHLTLKFLGNTSKSLVERIKGAIEQEISDFPTFTVSLGEGGVFPNTRRPRVLWLKVEQGKDEIITIQNKIDKILFKHFRIPREKRAYHPHLTLGRIRKPCSLKQELNHISEQAMLFQKKIKITKIIYFESILQPSGAEYKIIASWKLHKLESEEITNG